jgi:hypothetical protein
MLNVIIFDAMPTTRSGSLLLALCVLKITEERCVLLPTILTPSRRLTKARRTKSPVKQKPDGSFPEESSKPKADESQAEKRSKPKDDESEGDNNNPDENHLHEDPRRVGPSNFTGGQRPSGFSSVITSHSTTAPKSLTPSQLKKKRKYDKALDNQNPSNMYPSGRLARSTTSDYETKWWLDNKVEEKPGVTPADDHLAKRPVKTHIFLREEMEAFAEEKLKVLKDIDEKKDFLDIIKSAVALKSSLLLAENHAESQKGALPLGLFIPAIPYSDQGLVNLSCLVDRGREFDVDTEYESRNKFAIRVDLYQLDPMRKLKSYLKKGSKDPPARPLMIAVYKDWLKQYLDWFDPDLFEYISAHAAGMKVSTFANQLASNYDHDYQMQAQIQYDPLLGPVPKMHISLTR